MILTLGPCCICGVTKKKRSLLPRWLGGARHTRWLLDRHKRWICPACRQNLGRHLHTFQVADGQVLAPVDGVMTVLAQVTPPELPPVPVLTPAPLSPDAGGTGGYR